MTTFTCSYQFGGRHHVVHVAAADESECSGRLRAIGMTAEAEDEVCVGNPVRCRYRFNGREYTVDVFAADERECALRLSAIGRTAQIDGELISEVSLPGPLSALFRGLSVMLGRR